MLPKSWLKLFDSNKKQKLKETKQRTKTGLEKSNEIICRSLKASEPLFSLSFHVKKLLQIDGKISKLINFTFVLSTLQVIRKMDKIH